MDYLKRCTSPLPLEEVFTALKGVRVRIIELELLENIIEYLMIMTIYYDLVL